MLFRYGLLHTKKVDRISRQSIVNTSCQNKEVIGNWLSGTTITDFYSVCPVKSKHHTPTTNFKEIQCPVSHFYKLSQGKYISMWSS